MVIIVIVVECRTIFNCVITYIFHQCITFQCLSVGDILHCDVNSYYYVLYIVIQFGLSCSWVTNNLLIPLQILRFYTLNVDIMALLNILRVFQSINLM